MDILGVLTAELGVKRSQIEAAVNLIDEGNTIPFIARYRKEVTGSLNDEVLRNLDERLKYLRGLEERKTPVSYTHLRAHETDSYLVCRLLLEKKKKDTSYEYENE